MSPEEKQAEEDKRERAYDPLQRWHAILDAIAFAEANVPPEQRRNRPRWHPSTRFRVTPDAPFTAFLHPPPDHSVPVVD